MVKFVLWLHHPLEKQTAPGIHRGILPSLGPSSTAKESWKIGRSADPGFGWDPFRGGEKSPLVGGFNPSEKISVDLDHFPK